MLKSLPRTKVPAGASLLGMRFGKLSVIKQAESYKPGSKGGTRWRVQCDCGKVKIVGRRPLVGGRTVSCGCWHAEVLRATRFKHGMTTTKTYYSWSNMRGRCGDPKNAKYSSYGGRGISVCARWQGHHGFENFLADLGEKPNGMTLERIDVNGNYEPGNVKWASPSEQSNNRRLSASRVARILDEMKASSSDLLERFMIDRIRSALLG